MSNSEVWNNIS